MIIHDPLPQLQHMVLMKSSVKDSLDVGIAHLKYTYVPVTADGVDDNVGLLTPNPFVMR
jgi:hypothetical protein